MSAADNVNFGNGLATSNDTLPTLSVFPVTTVVAPKSVVCTAKYANVAPTKFIFQKTQIMFLIQNIII